MILLNYTFYLNLYYPYLVESKVNFFITNLLNDLRTLLKSIWLFLTNIHKIKLMLLLFIVIYGIFFGYILVKLYINYNNDLKNIEYQSLTGIINDSSTLLKDRVSPLIPNLSYSKAHINNVYNTLGIINYQDFIYLKSKDTQQLALLCNKVPHLNNKLIDIAINDMFGSHLELVTDINRIFIKSLLKLSSPLIASIISMFIITGYETLVKTFLILL